MRKILVKFSTVNVLCRKAKKNYPGTHACPGSANCHYSSLSVVPGSGLSANHFLSRTLKCGFGWGEETAGDVQFNPLLIGQVTVLNEATAIGFDFASPSFWWHGILRLYFTRNWRSCILSDMENKKVKIYSTPTCVWCRATKDYLTEHKVVFEDINVAQDAVAREYMFKRTGQMGVPVIEIGNDVIVGFDEERIGKLLGLNS